MRSLDLGLYKLSTNEKFVVGGLGVIIESKLNRVRLSCCWVGVGLGCDNRSIEILDETNKLFSQTLLKLYSSICFQTYT